MTTIEKKQNIDIPDTNKQIDEKLKNLDALKKEQKIALSIAHKIDISVPNYSIDLAIDRENNKYHIIGNAKTPFKLPLNVHELDKYSADIITLLNFDGDLQLIGGSNWRAIADIQWIGGYSNAEQLVTYSQNDLTNDQNIDENNKIEELYKFIQTLKNIPREKWVILISIGDDIGIKSKSSS